MVAGGQRALEIECSGIVSHIKHRQSVICIYLYVYKYMYKLRTQVIFRNGTQSASPACQIQDIAVIKQLQKQASHVEALRRIFEENLGG